MLLCVRVLLVCLVIGKVSLIELVFRSFVFELLYHGQRITESRDECRPSCE